MIAPSARMMSLAPQTPANIRNFAFSDRQHSAAGINDPESHRAIMDWMSALLPEKHRRPPVPDYTIATMPVGAEHDVQSTALVIDSDWTCYLRPDAKIVQSGYFQVRREPEGYHVTIRLPVMLSPDPAFVKGHKEKLIPVLTVTGPE